MSFFRIFSSEISAASTCRGARELSSPGVGSQLTSVTYTESRGWGCGDLTMASTSAAGGAGGVAGKKPRMGGASSLGIAPGPRGPPEEAPGTTLAHQDELPSLPLPPLRDTLARYLRSVQPLCTPEELKATTALVEDFGRPGGEGERLHAVLAEKASRERNWLIDWWNRAAYLAWGEPMAPQEATAFGPVPGLNVSLSQVQRAAMAIQGVAEYHRMVQEGRLPVLRVRGVKTCMAQVSAAAACRSQRVGRCSCLCTCM